MTSLPWKAIAKAFNKQARDATSDFVSLSDECIEKDNEVFRLEQQLNEALDLLRRLEWGANNLDSQGPRCPYCGMTQADADKDPTRHQCGLAKVLRQHTP